MSDHVDLVIATRNKGKTAEIVELLKGFPVCVRDLGDYGPIPLVEEDGKTFEENAYKKAAFTSRILGFPALADDSGLLVQALGNAPGVHSARYGGEQGTDQDRCDRLLRQLQGVRNREAAFECVLSLAVPTGAALTYTGRCEGLIAHAPVGGNGFGYDPVFYYPEMDKTFAQMTMEEKSRVSHRGTALAEMKSEFAKVLIWIRQQMPTFQPISFGGERP